MPENGMRHGFLLVGTENCPKEIVLGAGLEPACLSAYAPQTYVSAIPPPELYAPGSKLSAYSNRLQVALASMKSLNRD